MRKNEAVCGRYALAGDWSELQKDFALEEIPGLEPEYNIAPCSSAGFEAPILVRPGELSLGRFWFIPSWWDKSLKRLPTTFNARSETVLTKSFFKGARSCVIPVSNWREFPGNLSNKRAVNFHRPESQLQDSFFAFAGVYSSWTSPDTGEETLSYAILTAPANRLVSPHHHRMPLILPQALYGSWCAPESSLQELLPTLLAQKEGEEFVSYEGSTWGNSTRARGARCIAKVEQTTLFS